MRHKLSMFLAVVMMAVLLPTSTARAETTSCSTSTDTGVELVCTLHPDGNAGGKDTSVLVQWANRINAAPSGSKLYIAVHLYDGDANGGKILTDAINASVANFTEIKILTTDTPAAAVTALDNGSTRLVKDCGGTSCLPGYQGGKGNANHPKMIILERPGLDTVYSIGSQNFTDTQGGANRFNDTIFLNETANGTITTQLKAFFDRMWNKNWSGWDTTAEKTASSGNVKVYAGPRTEAGTVKPLWANILKNVTCPGNGYVILVNFSTWSSNRFYDVTDELDRLEGDCRVRVIAGDSGDHTASQASYGNLTDWKGDTTNGFNLHNGRVAYDTEIHNKMLILKNVSYSGGSNVVFTGSYNLSNNGLLYNTDLMVRVAGTDVVNQYFDYAKTLWAGSLGRGSSSGNGCGGGGKTCLDEKIGSEW